MQMHKVSHINALETRKRVCQDRGFLDSISKRKLRYKGQEEIYNTNEGFVAPNSAERIILLLRVTILLAM